MPAPTASELLLLALVFAVVLLFIGPALVAIIRRVDGLGEFVFYNALCFVMPIGLIVAWVMAFIWPRREPPMRYTHDPPCAGPPTYRDFDQ